MLQINLRGEVKIGDFGMSVQLNSTLGRAFTWVGKVRPSSCGATAFAPRHSVLQRIPSDMAPCAAWWSSRHGILVDERPHSLRLPRGTGDRTVWGYRA